MSKPIFDKANKIWHGPKIPPIYNPDQNLGQLILKVLQQTPDSINQISADTDVSVTCQQMHDRSVRIAKYLTKCGMKDGDVIGFVATNTENLAPIVIACFALGLPVNPLSPIMNEKDIVQMFTMTKPKIIFCDADNVKVVKNAVDEMKSEAKVLTVMDKVDGYECVTEILKEMEGESVDDIEFPSTDPNSTVMVLCSSGSTGSPKGVCKSHKQFIYDFHPYFKQNTSKPIRAFQTSHIYWFSGIYYIVIGALYKLVRIITTKSIEPQLVVDIINKYQANTLMIAPYAISKILQIENLQPMDSITYLMIGGSVLSRDIFNKFKNFIPNGTVVNCYGCSEEDYIAISEGDSEDGGGVPVVNTQVKIVDEAMNSLGPNEQGEIFIKKPVQFTEYFGDPEKTQATFDGEWFKTGDIGYFDDNGCLYIVDRKKEMLKYNNFQVTPSEIESVINEIKGIVNSSVVGVYDSNDGNDIIHAFVIVNESSNLTENFILEQVNGKVSEPKKIRGGVHIVKSFPLTFSGKISKIKLRKMAKELNF
ncbi:luciferin 4-monooxygenase-like [Chironomus tepperi]|uniref:luciferin 4-monooxygenase-like n=1 Tax=Chironomus tepperi TaxID=113505 RepID=UPI00391FAA6A